MKKLLHSFELLVLLTVRRLDKDASCAHIAKVLSVSGVERSLAQVSLSLSRLKKRKLLKSITISPVGRKTRTLFFLTEGGKNEIAAFTEVFERLR